MELSIVLGRHQPGRLRKQLRIAVSGHKAQPCSLLVPFLSVPRNFDDGPQALRAQKTKENGDMARPPDL